MMMMMMMMTMTIVIYCNLVSTRWQRSVVLYKNRNEIAQKEKQYTNIQKHGINKIDNKNVKQKTNINNIKKYKSSN